MKNGQIGKLKLRKYQEEGIEFLLKTGGRAILADEMGSGKSTQALTYAIRAGHKKVLVICPASVKSTWESEVAKWTNYKSFIIHSKLSLESVVEAIADSQVIIINYDILKKYINLLYIVKFDCLIIDEFHYIKSPRAIRSKSTTTLSRQFKSVVLLSGTPILNRPIEIYPALNIIDPAMWKNWYYFAIKYCNGHQGRWGFECGGASNMKELRRKIEPIFLRRVKRDILPDLPPKRYIDLAFDMSDEDRKNYDKIEKDFIGYLREIKKRSGEQIKRALRAQTLVKLNEMRQFTSQAKKDYTLEIINGIIDNGEKSLVFSVFNQPLEYLQEKLGSKAVLLTGKTNGDDRALAINEFQEKKTKDIFLGGMKSAGQGITLTEASNVVLIDYPWVPAETQQAQDRIHRIGQTADKVTIYQLYATKTIDSHMKKILTKKKEIIDNILDGKDTIDSSSIEDELIKLYEEKI